MGTTPSPLHDASPIPMPTSHSSKFKCCLTCQYCTLHLYFSRNLLILAIVPRTAVRVGRSAKLYYSIIAIADLLELLVGSVLWSFLDDGLLLLTGNRFSLRIVRYSDVTCKLFYLLCELTGNLSNYTIVALSIERCLIVFFPLRAKGIVCLRFSVMLIMIIVAPSWLCSFITVPIIVYLDRNMQYFSQSGIECDKNNKHSLTPTFTVMLTILSYTLHTILNIILVTLISIKLAHIRYKRNAMIRDNLIHITANTCKSNSTSNNWISNFVGIRLESSRPSSKESHNALTETVAVSHFNKHIALVRRTSDQTNVSNPCSAHRRLRIVSSPSTSSSSFLPRLVRQTLSPLNSSSSPQYQYEQIHTKYDSAMHFKNY